MKSSLRQGFTLIELLVVIAIIAILSTVGLTAFTNAQRGGRDAKRTSDIKDMQNAFEQYYAATSSSYAACATMATGYLQGNALPRDPRTNVAYPCNFVAGPPQSYCSCATLETPGKGNSADAACGFGAVGANATGYFCIRNLQ